MKRLSFVLVVFLVSLLMTNSALAVDFNEVVMEAGVYKWSNPNNWEGTYPDGTVEIKIRKSDDDTGDICTLDSVEIFPYSISARMRVYEGATLNIVAGAVLEGPDWLRVGASNPGTLNQTGGLLKVRRAGGDCKVNMGDSAGSDGHYNISGGTMTYDSSDGTGQLTIGDRGGTGKLKITGDTCTVDMGSLRIGGRDPGRGATGTIEFNLTSSASVSPVEVGYTRLDPDGDASTADLIVTTTAVPTAPVVLVKNSSDAKVMGRFDSVTLTGDFGAYTFLHYYYDADSGTVGNDIVLIPEPATLVLLGLGSLVALRRRK